MTPDESAPAAAAFAARTTVEQVEEGLALARSPAFRPAAFPGRRGARTRRLGFVITL